MITAGTVYWITRLDYIRNLLILVPLGLTILFLFWVALNVHLDNEVNETFVFSVLLICILLLGLGGIIRCFIPTTKEMLWIKGISAIESYANNANIGDLLKEHIHRIIGKGE